ncbi:hypothetical protein MLD52_21155 [Puniceicoccaceae bacterium K14]|nr:hypothetical protein [Puniceicoccaceae bacterium K14]
MAKGPILKRILIGSLVLFALLCSMTAFFVHSRNNAPPDESGNTPLVLVENFIEAIRERDYTGAIEYVNGDVPEVIVSGSGLTFEDYCLKHFDCDTYQLDGPSRGKPGVFFVRYKGELNGSGKSFLFALELIDGQWKIVL